MIAEDSEPIHTWFNLSYSSHLVLDPSLTGCLPQAWQAEMAAMLDQLARSFPDVNPHGDETVALAAVAREYWELGEYERLLAGVTISDDEHHDGCNHDADDAEGCEYGTPDYYDWRGDEHGGHEYTTLPTETLEQARAAGRTVVSRTLLQSMPTEWQARFVRLLSQADSVDAEAPETYDIRFYTADGHRTTDPVPNYNRGRTQLVPTVAAT